MAVNLHAELWRAMSFARAAAADDPKTANLLSCVLPFHGVQWGFDFVAFYGAERASYELQEDGSPAIIVPVVEDGDTLDLCAIDPDSQHVGTRLGLSRGLGLDAITKARMGCCDLHLVERPLDWLRSPVVYPADYARGPVKVHGVYVPREPVITERVYLFKLSDAVAALDGVGEFTCAGFEFAERVRALFPPWQRDRILVGE
jgi:hypothetical protein